jgi:hypothetical protein
LKPGQAKPSISGLSGKTSFPGVLGGQIAEATTSWSLASGAIGVQLSEKFDKGALASIAQGRGAILAGQLMPKLAAENAFKRWSIRPLDPLGSSEKLEAWMRPGSIAIGKPFADRSSINNFPTLLDQISGRINQIAGAGKITLLQDQLSSGALASIAQGRGAILAGQLMPKLAAENAFKRWSIRPLDPLGSSEKLEAWMRPGSIAIGKPFADRSSINNFPTLLDQISGRINQIAGAGKITLLQDQLSSGALASIAQGRGAILAGQLMPKLAAENAFKRWSSVSAADWMERLWRVPALFQRMERAERELAAVYPTGARLAVLLRHVGVGRAVEMLELMVSSGPAPLVAVLAEIVLDPSALKAFEVAVEAACLSSQAENDLIHALEHLGEGDPDRAFPPLVTGLEGALRDAVRAQGDRKKRPNARALAAVLSLDKDHQLLIGEIYSEVNDGRHGNELDRHAACVLALVGLTIWMDECLEKPAVEWLGRELDHRLTKHPALAA